ncbi:MAG: polysaccharide deacetylase family protein [Geminicoccaceae bacterium]
MRLGDNRLGRLARRALQRAPLVGDILTRGMIDTPASHGVEANARVYDAYADQARALGLDDIRLFLSFDCDTDRDPKAALEVMTLLDALGIKATFAVPGAALRRSAEIYRRLMDRGAEFMNHGDRPHAAWQDDRFVSVTFYESMSFEEVEADIRKGHETMHEVLGIRPLGFRAPHFGHFQEPDQLGLVHRVARDLGYRYCSTTLPSYGLAHGPAHDTGGIVELPTFGTIRSPVSLLDSWSHLSDRRDYALSDMYETLLIETVDAFSRLELPALLTWYVDPAHVAGQAAFERSMQELARRRVPSLGAMEAASLLRTA